MNTIDSSTSSVADFKNRLIRYKEDLAADGRSSLVLAASVYSGTNHQDGRTLLAIRRFLKDVKANHPKLEGVVFVGRFPEASVVWKWTWLREVRSCGDLVFDNKRILKTEVGLVAPRTDIPLADLDGNWESIYTQERRKVEAICAAPLPSEESTWEEGFKAASFTLTSQKFVVGPNVVDSSPVTYQDFFW